MPPFETVELAPTGSMNPEEGSPEQAASQIIDQGFLDEGPEKNPANHGEGVDETPHQDEVIETLGESDKSAESQITDTVEVGEDGLAQQEEIEETGDLYTVTVQGESRDVTLDELQSGFMLQSDYTKKTQVLADERRQFEMQSNAVLQERQQYVRLLANLEQQLNSGGEQEPDWIELSQSDPVGYTRQRAAWDQRQTVIDAAKVERERVEGLQQQDFARQSVEHGQHQRSLMVAARPELADPEKANEFQQSLRKYATETFGFTDQELGQIVDHRQALILEKAMLYDQARAKGGEVQKIIKQKGPRAVIRPGAARGTEVVRTRQNRQAQDRFDRSGDVRDAGVLMEKFV